MGVGLSYAEVALLKQTYQDYGQTQYMVDSDYRTAAQGWSRADRTGPLDLYEARKAGHGGTQYVFRTGDYSTDTLAIQAGIDEQVDFRGDTLFFTPGAYAPLTALTLNVPDSRWLGPQRARGMSARITVAVDGLVPTAAADNFELAYLRIVPTTAGSVFLRSTAGADNWWLHNFTYDARGIGASTGTIFLEDTGACLNTFLEDFLYLSNTANGPLYQIAAASITGAIRNFLHIHTANTIVTSLFETITGGAGATGFTIGPGHTQLGGGGLVTQYGAMIDMTDNNTNATIVGCTSSVGANVAGTGWEAGTGVAAEGDIVNSWIATIGGGTGRAALVGTA